MGEEWQESEGGAVYFETNRFEVRAIRYPAGGFTVELPHKCQTWEISGDSDWDDTVSAIKAMDDVDVFIGELQEVKDWLMKQPGG